MGFHFVFLSLPILPGWDPDNLQLLQLVGSTSLSSQAARGCCFGWVPSFLLLFLCFGVAFPSSVSCKIQKPLTGSLPPFQRKYFCGHSIYWILRGKKKEKWQNLHWEWAARINYHYFFFFWVDSGLCFVPWVIEKCWPGFWFRTTPARNSKSGLPMCLNLEASLWFFVLFLLLLLMDRSRN